MASVCNRPNGLRCIQFVDAGGKRQTLRLGRITSKDAAEVCRRVEMLLTARIAGTSLDRETATWVADLGGKLRNRLVKFGLIDKPADKPAAITLDAFIADYLATRSDLKPSTRLNLEIARRNLVAFFGAGKPLAEITPGDADEWRLWGMARNRQTGKSANVGTTMAKIVKRSGLTPWPKLFHNLWASRQTELEGQGFPQHVVCAWLGNSPKVAREHYLWVTEADYRRAAGGKSDAKSDVTKSEKATQNPTLHTAASSTMSRMVHVRFSMPAAGGRRSSVGS